MTRPEQQTVLITGGSRGIGAASVLAFAKAGYRVAFTWHSSDDTARRVVETVQQTVPGSTVLAIRADAADSAQVRDAVAQTARELGGPQVLVCNAGIAQQKLFTDLTDEDWRRMMSVDLDGVFYACRAALPGMIRESTAASSASAACGARQAAAAKSITPPPKPGSSVFAALWPRKKDLPALR